MRFFCIAFNAYAGVFSDAIRNEDKIQITKLVRNGHNINDPDSLPLFEAINHGNIEIILHLLNQGADPNAAYATPSSSAASRYYTPALLEADTVQIIIALLVYGADPNLYINSLHTVFSYAMNNFYFLHYVCLYFWLALPPSITSQLIQMRITDSQQLNNQLFAIMPVLLINSLVVVLSDSTQIFLNSFPIRFHDLIKPFAWDVNVAWDVNECFISSPIENWDE